jgi:nucleoside-triphosphatase
MVLKNVLLTGPPGCGKTTALLRLMECITDLCVAGFVTEEIREHGQRVGFEAVGLSSSRKAMLAHTRSRSHQRVGRYGVEQAGLAQLVATELAGPPHTPDVYVIDEIGKMELLCPAFVEAVPRLLDGPLPVVATVARRGGGLIAAVKARPDVQLIEVTEENRDGLPTELAAQVKALALQS